ncbi:MAG: hypothetical protein HY941_00760 [Gammaproteobacteria bacterium]|nr:hypothetical protein [Gammaproteobacteria bacterium]
MLPEVNFHPQVWHVVGAALLFPVLFPGLSYWVNQRLCKSTFVVVPREMALLAALVFLLAILFEASLNPLYTRLFGAKLWVYRLFPLHDGNVSALALVAWTSYGVHLYFLNQTLDSRIAAGTRRNLIKAALIGLEAPLLWEVLGNGFFLLTVGEFYAYYLPGDVFHFTSLRVIPVYMLCIYSGLHVHGYLRRHAADWRLIAGLFAAGIAFLGVGLGID